MQETKLLCHPTFLPLPVLPLARHKQKPEEHENQMVQSVHRCQPLGAPNRVEVGGGSL